MRGSRIMGGRLVDRSVRGRARRWAFSGPFVLAALLLGWVTMSEAGAQGADGATSTDVGLYHLYEQHAAVFWSLALAVGAVATLLVIVIVGQVRGARDRARAASIVEATLDGFWLVDARGRIRDVNEAFCRIVGYSRGELLRMTIRDLEAQESPEDTRARIERVMRGGPERFETRHRRKDGTVVDVEVTATFVREGGFLVGFFRDISDRKRSEVAIRAREATLQSLFRAAPIGIGLVVDRVLLRVNERLCEMLGYGAAELVGQNARMVYPTQEEYEYVGREKYRQIALHGVGTVETRWVRKDGQLIDILLSSSPVDPGNLEAGVTFTALDITDRVRVEAERQRLEAQLRHAQKMEAIGQLAGGVAHDFNNILTAILANVEMLANSLRTCLGPDHPLLQGLGEVDRAAHRAASLTRQLLVFSRRDIARPETVDLNRTLRELEKMLRRLLTENITLEIKPAAELPTVRADAGQLEQVILNLVLNARDAMPDGGRLTLETTAATLDETYVAAHAETHLGPHVVLIVSDTGCGMTPEVRERIFEPFFTTKPVGQGTGLGLATVYGIVRQAGGHVQVYSEPDRGTTFRVYLPVDEAGARQVAPEPGASELLGGTETVLVCEDDRVVRELIGHVLGEVGYHVLTAACGREALQIARNCGRHIDLLLTDVIIPDMNGRAVADALRDERPDVRTLFVSGYTADVIAHHGVLDEGVEFLPKPFSRQTLLRRVRAVLDDTAVAGEPTGPLGGERA